MAAGKAETTDDEASARAEACIRATPKVELHVHLEGAVRPARFLAICRRHGLHPEFGSVSDLTWLFQHSDFPEFLDHFRFVVTCLRDTQDVHDIACDLFRELLAQNVVYAEVLFSGAIFVRMGMPWQELLAAVAAAESTVLEPRRRGALLPRYNLVIDLVRNFGPEFAALQVEALAEIAHPSVVGVHLGGDEVAQPARLFAGAYAAARAAGLGAAAHAGEGDGAASVRDALEFLQVSRIGHGIRCLEDADVVRELLLCGTTLEVCPTSNVCTRIVPDLARHPLPELLRRGLRVTLGADDPSYFDTDLTREMLVAHRVLGLDLAQIDAMTDAGMMAAFLPAQQKAAALAWLRAERAVLEQSLRSRSAES
ncbi:MAG TPA: adenosine deaminase [Candidatus Krumholzibacteria bacterium]|nr:adenosine deaminase [Candidatus Krumholzibacteria bacterium]